MSFDKILLNNLIGQGTYGTVYKCVNEFNDEMAVKCINIKEDGIPCLMELSLMSSVSHLYLNSAIKIHLTSSKIYIIQNLAISDLHQWRKNNQRPPDEQLRSWSFQLLTAIHFLHKNNIIHHDIKSTNILIFSSGNQLILKLSDFSLSCFTSTSSDLIGTYTHLPIEVWLGRHFNEKIDIWALGCTLFELNFGYSLIPPQLVLDTSDSLTTKYNQLTDMYINTLINLSEQLSQSPKFEYRSPCGADTKVQQYTPCLLPPHSSLPFATFLFSLLIVDPISRPSTSDLLSLPYFSSLISPTLSPIPLRQTLPPFVFSNIQKTVRKLLSSTFSDDTLINRLTTTSLQIISKLSSLSSLSDTLKIIGAVWISFKLVLKYSPQPSFFSSLAALSLSQLVQLEKTITTFLHFNLLHFPFIVNFDPQIYSTSVPIN